MKGNNLFMKYFLACLLVSLLFVSTQSFANDAARIGLEIAREADRRDQGFADLTANITMIIKQDGSQQQRELKFSALELNDDGEKRLFVFRHPADIKGTAVLNYSHIKGDDDQWIFLPAFKRVKRISSANKTTPFVGSEFAYEDLVSIEVPKYHYLYLGDEEIQGQSCFKVQFTPSYENSGYSRQIVYLDKQYYRILKVDFFDHQNALFKTLTANGYKQYLGKYWRPDSLHMVNHRDNRQTIMQWQNIKMKNGLSQRDFTVMALKRSR